MICNCEDIGATRVVIDGEEVCQTILTTAPSCGTKTCPEGYILSGDECILNYVTSSLCPPDQGYTYNATTHRCEKTVISPAIIPEFNSIQTEYCITETISLPEVSDNGITGVWTYQTIIDDLHFLYTFTPTSNVCAATITQEINVIEEIIPTFTITRVCPGTLPPTLPTTSDNGIIGTWYPAPNTSLTQVYTFTPNPGQCATTLLLDSSALYTYIWQEKNLDVTTYRNGDTITQVDGPSAWTGLTTGAWCYYDNDPANGPIYGKLYNWYAVNNPRGLAPEGYHIPSDEEWDTYIACLGGGSVAGGKMKEAGATHWATPNTGATNSSGFTGLPGGSISTAVPGSEYFGSLSFIGDFWSSTEVDSTNGSVYPLNHNLNSISGGPALKTSGYSVRCIKD